MELESHAHASSGTCGVQYCVRERGGGGVDGWGVGVLYREREIDRDRER
jgi:hypothetical protein